MAEARRTNSAQFNKSEGGQVARDETAAARASKIGVCDVYSRKGFWTGYFTNQIKTLHSRITYRNLVPVFEIRSVSSPLYRHRFVSSQHVQSQSIIDKTTEPANPKDLNQTTVYCTY